MGGTGIKVPLSPLSKGDLGGSRTFDTDKRTFQTSSQAWLGILAAIGTPPNPTTSKTVESLQSYWTTTET